MGRIMRLESLGRCGRRMDRRIWIDLGAGKATPTMTTDSVPVDRIASPLEQADALLWARVALMSELQASLRGGRKALQALDLPALHHQATDHAPSTPHVAAV